MNKKNILFNFALVVPIFYLTLMVYTQLVGFHAALPYPESWVNELRNGEQLPPVKYWGFVVVTLIVPYAIYLVCTSFLALKFMFMPALLFGVFAALIGYIAPLGAIWGKGYVYTLYAVSLIPLSPAIVLWYKNITKVGVECVK